MERLEISVACRNYYGEDVAQLRTSQGDFPEIVSGDSCWRAVLYRWNYQGSKGSFGQTETRRFGSTVGKLQSHRSLEQYERGLVGR